MNLLISWLRRKLGVIDTDAALAATVDSLRETIKKLYKVEDRMLELERLLGVQKQRETVRDKSPVLDWEELQKVRYIELRAEEDKEKMQ